MGQKDQFWPKTAKFGPKKSNFFGHFLKDQKISNYGKNQKKLKQRLGEHFWPKTTKFWPKTAKKSKTRIFARNFFSPFFKRPKNQLLWQKSEKIKVAFEGRNGPKRAFLAKNDQILAQNGQKIENVNFTAEFFSSFQVPMAKIRSILEKWVKKTIFGQKRPNLGQKNQI